MHYLVILGVPVLMLADYYLTLWGAVLRERSGYTRFFVLAHYELNPAFQADVANLRWFNPRHLLLSLLFTALLLVITWFTQLDPNLNFGFDLLIGFVSMIYFVLIGMHLANLLTFRYVQKNPQQLTGQVQLGFEFTIAQAQNQMLFVLVPLIVVALVTQSFFVIGGIFGVLSTLVSFTRWKRKARLTAQRPVGVIADKPSG